MLIRHQKYLGVPSALHPALTSPSIPVENEVESPQLQCSSSTESTSKPSSPSSTCSVASSASYTLWPRLPITYNEAALSLLQDRQQIRILNNLSIPLLITSSNDESEADTPAEVEADSLCQNNDESLKVDPGTDSPQWPGVESPSGCHQPSPHQDSSRGVINVPDQDCQLKPLQRTLAYAQALQYWAEKANLHVPNEPHHLAMCVHELRQCMKRYMTFSDHDVFEGLMHELPGVEVEEATNLTPSSLHWQMAQQL